MRLPQTEFGFLVNRTAIFLDQAVAIVSAFVFVFFVTLSTCDAQTDNFSPAEIEFFESKIRPLLVEHCLDCHGANAARVRGGLRLTSRKEMLKGGDSGPAIVLGNLDESLLIESIRYDGFEMPPKGKLSPEEIEAFEKWVSMGAPDPRTASSAPIFKAPTIREGKKFWAFQPPQNHQPPVVANTHWPTSDIDRFVLAKLEENGIQPIHDADRQTLIRRIYLTLVGLPPEPEKIDSWVSDPRETSVMIGDLVDELLSHSQFGERWGRHWLDVARFAESSGGGRSLMFPHAWRYRDYVIRSFNEDKPFDQFVTEQIAGDLLSSESEDQRNQQLIATGFLALGPTNYEQQDKELLKMEVIDEQIDTIGKAFLGLTIGCARCHDHKFDPIPTSDYYALAGIFGSTQSLVNNNVSKYVVRNLVDSKLESRINTHRSKVERISGELNQIEEQLKNLGIQVTPKSSAPKSKSYPIDSFSGWVIDNRDANKVGIWQSSTFGSPFIGQDYIHDKNETKGIKSVTFVHLLEEDGVYEVQLSYSANGNRASNVPVTIFHQDGQSTTLVDQTQPTPIDGAFISLGSFRFSGEVEAKVVISNEKTNGHVIVDSIRFLSPQDSAVAIQSKNRQPAVGRMGQGTDANFNITLNQSDVEHSRLEIDSKQLIQRFNRLHSELTSLKKSPPGKLPMTMSVKESRSPSDGHIHIRGSAHHLGPVVPRGFLSVCCQDNFKPNIKSNESGRLQLARWIANSRHPLTARVYVNRVWRHLFGKGLVESTENFGKMGRLPTHPKLLDYLAQKFTQSGWSTKKLIREIILSRVYGLDSNGISTGSEIDPENHLLWKANRRRVDAEVLRDSILLISGQLDDKPGGRTIRKLTQYDLGYQFQTVRRSVYVPAFRNSMLDLFEVFDFANPNLVVGHRNSSTLPTQALFMMNSSFVISASQKLAQQILQSEDSSRKEKIERLYLKVIGRIPDANEMDLAIEFLDSFQTQFAQDQIENGWASFCHALFASLEFRFFD